MTRELPSRHGAAPPLRASHADRDLTVDILRVSAGDGRLTLAELDERLETALTARTIGELAAVTADLPGGNLLQAACRAWASGNVPELTAGPAGRPRQVSTRFIHNDDPGRPDPAANAGPGPASRWAFLQALLNEPRPHQLLPR
jgi:hypothetical protein